MTIRSTWDIDGENAVRRWRVYCDGAGCGVMKPPRGRLTSVYERTPEEICQQTNRDATEEGWLVADPYHYCPKCQDADKINNSVDTVSRKERETV